MQIVREIHQHVCVKAQRPAGHAAAGNLALHPGVHPHADALVTAGLDLHRLAAVAGGVDARIVRLHMLVHVNAAPHGKTAVLQKGGVGADADAYGNRVRREAVPVLHHGGQPPVAFRLNVVEHLLKGERNALLPEIGVDALRRFRKRGDGEDPFRTVYERTRDAALDHVLHDLDADPRRADHERRADAAGIQHRFEMHGVVRRAHFENAGQTDAGNVGDKGGSAGAEENVVIRPFCSVLQNERPAGCVERRDRRFGIKPDAEAFCNVLQRAERLYYKQIDKCNS